MRHAHPETVAGRHWPALALGDLISFLVIAALGRASHNMALPVLAVLQTAAPFLLGWLIVAPFLGAYRADLVARPGRMAARTLGVWAVACALGLVLRSWWLQRDIVVAFALVTLATNAVSLVGWRTLYAWRNSRRTS